MKKIISLLLVLAMCCSLFACAKTPEETVAGPALEDAVEYLESSYSGDEGKKTPADFKMPAQVPIDGVKFEVTWECSLETIEIVLEDGLYTIKVPNKNEEEVEYTLTATIKDAAGNSKTLEFKRVLPIYDDGAAVTEPVEGEAYKLYLVQANAGKTVFALPETQTKYITSDVDPKKGADFYVEKVDGGYKFYTEIDGVKNYVHAHTETAEDGKVSKFIGYATESDCVYYYKAEVKAWLVKIDNTEYVVGTYSSYETICISESSYITAENTGVSQFPIALMAKEAAEELAPTEGPKDPTELSSITEILEIAGGLENSAQTAEKYLVKGTIVEIKSEQYGNMYIEDEDGNRLYVYGVYNKDGSARFDAMDPQPKVGDTITLMGVLSMYNDEGQMKNGWTQELVAGDGTEIPGEGDEGDEGDENEEPVTPSGDPAADSQLTIAEAIALGASKEHNTYTEGKYYVTGTITEIYNDQYGNMYITDGNGNTLTIYGTFSADGSTRFDAMDTKPAVGATVKIYGIIGQYNGTAQIKNGWIVEQSGGSTTTTPTPDPDPAPSTEPACVTSPEIGKAYKLGLWQSNKGEVYYFTGAMSGYYGATETDKSLAVDVYLEDAGNGAFYIYFMNGSTKSYLYGEASGTHLNFKFGDTKGVFTWNATYNTLMTTIGETVVFMGTYSNYVTFGMSAEEKLDSSYAGHLYN